MFDIHFIIIYKIYFDVLMLFDLVSLLYRFSYYIYDIKLNKPTKCIELSIYYF